MDRSFASFKKKRQHKTKHPLSQTQSSGSFRKILKNRTNHSNTSTDGHQSKFIEKQTEENRKSEFENMKDFVKSFRKIGGGIGKVEDKKTDNVERKENCPTQRSNRSSFSRVSERPVSKKINNSISNKTKKLEDLEKKVQNLLENKLILSKSQNSFSKLVTEIEEDEITKELNQIIDEIKFYKEEGTEEDNLSIKDISKKIQILEKIMAESFSEAEMFKKYFYHARSIRKSLFPFQKSTQFSKNREFMRKMSSISSFRQKPSIYSQSISQLSFNKPDKKAYPGKGYSSSKYLANRQPLPKSSYNRDFLNYGNLPKYSYKQESIFIPNSLQCSKKQTFYESDFNEKKTSLIDPRQLDCTHDKIKRLKVSFIPTKNKCKNMIDNKKDIKLNKLASCKSKQNITRNPLLKTISKTQFKRQYTNKKLAIENPIKNKQFINLKYNFKASMHA